MKKHFAALALAAVSTFAASNSVFAAEDMALTDAQLDAAMSKADADKNGTVSLAEALKFGLTRKTFLHANPDKDGSLDKKEFGAAVVYQFRTANPDKDGTLDPKEAKKAGVKSKSAFEAANPDKDGTLDLAEYLAALMAQAK